MAAQANVAGALGAFAVVGAATLSALFAGVVVALGLSSNLGAKAAGDLLMWVGAGELVLVVVAVFAFRALARGWAGATPPWWAQLGLALGLAAVAALLFVFAMIGMNR